MKRCIGLIAWITVACSLRLFAQSRDGRIDGGAGGQKLPFSFDTGASSTDLTERYFRHFREHSGSWKKGENRSAGAGVTRAIYMQPELRLAVGTRTAILRCVSIFTQPLGSDLDDLCGNLGQDMVSGFASFTLDFSRMRFTLGEPIKAN